MKQPDLFASPTPDRPSEQPAERDLFGNPVNPTSEPAPTYRLRKPVQQGLNLEPGTFTLT